MGHLQAATPESHKGMALPADHHTSSEPPVGPVQKPQLRGPLELDTAVVKGMYEVESGERDSASGEV